MAKKRRSYPANGKMNTVQKKNAAVKKQHEQMATRRKLIITAGIVLILIGLLWAILPHPPAGAADWRVNDNGIIFYPADRGTPVFDSVIANFTSDNSFELINYTGRDARIKGLMRIPNHSGRVPGVLVLPGAGISKEREQALAADLADMGYASLVIDQRNLGQVDFQADARLFEAGMEPTEHKMVFDALRAVDVMRTYSEIDPDKIAIIGISNGGRFAIIAAAIDPSIKGVVGISTSGYDTESFINENAGQIPENYIRFLRSIDPDSYMDLLPPRKLVLIHMENDTLIPVAEAQKTYEYAYDPKIFYPLEGKGHGYNAAMKEHLQFELDQIFH